MLSCWKEKPANRQPLLRIRYTNFITNLICNTEGSERKWFETHFPGISADHYSCVLHSVGMAVLEFINAQNIEQKRNLTLPTKHTVSSTDRTRSNSVCSLLTVAGGSYGKIYNCVNRFIGKNLKAVDKVTLAVVQNYLRLKKFLRQLVMTPKEKEHPCFSKALKARDRGGCIYQSGCFFHT